MIYRQSGIYTYCVWGEKQADKYVSALYHRFEWFADQPILGKSRPDIKTGYYCYLQGSHLIFYTLNKDSINIIRLCTYDLNSGYIKLFKLKLFIGM